MLTKSYLIHVDLQDSIDTPRNSKSWLTHWHREKGVLSGGWITSQNLEELSFVWHVCVQNVRLSDNGTYHCEASNKFDDDSANAHLTVRGVRCI